MKQLNVSSISFVGDSTTRMVVQSLSGLLDLPWTSLYGCQKDCSVLMECGGGRSLNITFAKEIGIVSQDAERIEHVLQNADLAVLNFGPHYSLNGFRTNNSHLLSSFARDMALLAKLVRRAGRRQPRRVVYRSTPQGHPLCETFREPTVPGSAQELRQALAWSSNVEGFSWHLYPSYDRLARVLLEPVGVRFLDVTLLSHLRPDAHTAFRHGGGRLPPDCLHLTLPGLPDTWNSIMLGALSCEADQIALRKERTRRTRLSSAPW